MKTESMHIGMQVKHPLYGKGLVKSLTEHAAEVRFDGGNRTLDPQTSGLEPAETQAAITHLEMPLATLLADMAESLVRRWGLEKPDAVVDQLGARWHRGKLVLHPSDPTLATKEVPVEVFFHKIVMMRNNLRSLEQKINAHTTLSESEKIELQQYITRCYGSMTTFNLLFKSKEDQFNS